MSRLIPINIYRITYKIRLGKMPSGFVGEMTHKSMLAEKDIQFQQVIEKNLRKWNNSAHFDGILVIEKIGQE